MSLSTVLRLREVHGVTTVLHISIDPSTGVVTAASSITGSTQTATVTYTHTTGCEATATFTVMQRLR